MTNLSIKDLSDAISTIKYKPGWEFMIWEPDNIQGPMILITVTTLDAGQDDSIMYNTIELRITSPVPPMPCYESFYNWLLWRIKQIELHELLEWFKVDHQPYINPHQDY